MRVKSYIKLLMVAMLLTVSTGCSGKSTVEDSGNKNTDTYIREETEYFRSIMVADYKGTVDITRSEGDLVSAYEGLSLSDGDDVKVMDHSDLTLNVDSDKHLYADANTHFWLIASGTDGNTKTKIKLEEGSVLCQIKNKLLDNESFEIETPSSTMSVRGTVFRVSLIKGVKDDEVYELVEVFNGGVSTVIEVDGQSVELQPGECALIKEKEDGSEARFVLDDEIDEVFWKSDSMEFDIETEGGEGTPILKISYEKLTEMVLNSLMEISESGQELAVDTEVLEQVKETGHNYEEVSRVEPSCVKEGTVVRRCSICGGEMSESIPLVSHNYVLVSQTAADCNSTGLIVRRCTMCNDEAVETVAMTSHDYVQLARVESTCTKEGYISYKCSICGDVKREAIAKTEHKYELSERKEPSCTADGYIIYKCSVCGDTKTEVLEKPGHDYKATGEVVEATCTEHSKIEEKCTRCNDTRYVVDNDSKLAEHTLSKVSTEATCEEPAYSYEKCSVCGEEFNKVSKGEALGHSYEVRALSLNTRVKNTVPLADFGQEMELDTYPEKHQHVEIGGIPMEYAVFGVTAHYSCNRDGCNEKQTDVDSLASAVINFYEGSDNGILSRGIKGILFDNNFMSSDSLIAGPILKSFNEGSAYLNQIISELENNFHMTHSYDNKSIIELNWVDDGDNARLNYTNNNDNTITFNNVYVKCDRDDCNEVRVEDVTIPYKEIDGELSWSFNNNMSESVKETIRNYFKHDSTYDVHELTESNKDVNQKNVTIVYTCSNPNCLYASHSFTQTTIAKKADEDIVFVDDSDQPVEVKNSVEVKKRLKEFVVNLENILKHNHSYTYAIDEESFVMTHKRKMLDSHELSIGYVFKVTKQCECGIKYSYGVYASRDGSSDWKVVDDLLLNDDNKAVLDKKYNSDANVNS